jgi:Cu(I)/Ag(I) efflux system membrane fusion protein
MRITKKCVALLLVVLLAGAGLVSWSASSRNNSGHHRGVSAKYYCPMHPQVISDKPGDCPICHMRLVSSDSKAPQAEHQQKSTAQAKGPKQYYCPMHPQVVSDKPGECPICHMRLVPQNDDSAASGQKAERKLMFYRHPMNPKITSKVPAKDEMGMDFVPVYSDEMPSGSGAVEGYAGVSINPEKQQLIGMKTSTVEMRELSKEIVTVGKIAYDPELYQTQAEYIQAAKVLRESEGEMKTLKRQWAESVIQSARRKLIVSGLNEQMIEVIGKSDTPDERLLFGKTGEASWVYANIYEYEIPFVKVGDVMEVRGSALPEVLRGEIQAIDTVIDPMTRSVKVRATVKNDKGWLKPDMFVTVALHTKIGNVLSVPEEAILQSSTKAIAFVEKENGYFEPRKVTLGQRAAGFYEVKDGLMNGEKVVSNGNFFVDSESRLKAALSGMSGGSNS